MAMTFSTHRAFRFRIPWRFRLGLLGRISVALLVVGLLPLVTASFRLLQMNREAMTEQVLRTHAVAARTTAERVAALLSARRVVAQGAAAQAAVADDPRSPGATELLAELLRSGLGVVAVSVRSPEGEEVVRAQRREHAEAMEEVLARPFEEELTVVRRQGSAWLRFDLPLELERGWLRVVCDLSPLATALRPKELGEHAELLMVDRQGALVAGATGALARFPRELMGLALSGRISGSGRFSDEEEEAVLGAYAPVVGAPWIVLSRQSALVAEATSRHMQQRALISLAVAVGLVLGLTWIARESIVRPIRSLIAAQRRLAGTGEAAVAGGEIEQLKASFGVLERRLRDREALGEVSLGRYQVISVVGEGAMGTVFHGWDPTLKRSVAIKTVRFDRWVESERVELATRLLDEAVTVARFNHPNIVGLYDIQESPEVAFLTMEYVDGVSLERYIAARGPLPVAEVVPIALAVATGLSVAHSREVVHHDVKPGNVLLGRDGSIKVVDFGISQVITSLAESPDVLFGTPGYIPPEALQGEVYGPAGDLFALGVTIYLMLTGEMPFLGKSVQETLRQTLVNPVTPAGDRVAGVPTELDSLVLSLLEKDLERRCPSAEQAVQRLDALASAFDVEREPTLDLELSEPELELEGTDRLLGSQLVSRTDAPTLKGAAAG